MQSAWNKDGRLAFSFNVIEEVEDFDNLLEREQYWIDQCNVIEEGYNICAIAGSTVGWQLSRTDEERTVMAEGVSERMRKKWADRNGVEINIDSNQWYNEDGMADRWLKANDPDYGDRKKVDYLTARQYRYRAKEKEILTDPDLLDKSGEGGVMEWMKKKPRNGVLTEY